MAPDPAARFFIRDRKFGADDPAFDPSKLTPLEEIESACALADEKYAFDARAEKAKYYPVDPVEAVRPKLLVEEESEPELDGVTSLQREPAFPKPEELFSDRDAQSTADFQVAVDDNSEQAQRMRANAQKACASCPGHCCRAFHLPRWPRGQSLDDQIKMLRDRMIPVSVMDARTNEQALVPQSPEDEAARLKYERARMEADRIELETMEFFRENLVTLDESRSLFTCRAFDREKSRCTAYDRRPMLCRKFLCAASVLGQVPRFGFLASETLMEDGEINLNKLK